MQIDIRKGTKDDMQAVHDLIFELALYEKAPEEVTNTVQDMIRDGFSDTPIFHCLVATTNEKVIGMAIYFVKYSSIIFLIYFSIFSDRCWVLKIFVSY
jgi:hypothetical protein